MSSRSVASLTECRRLQPAAVGRPGGTCDARRYREKARAVPRLLTPLVGAVTRPSSSAASPPKRDLLDGLL
ncbi:hypothetical protein MRX96_002646 [Rhipicephalus microplus]